jgi:hypothetical protein
MGAMQWRKPPLPKYRGPRVLPRHIVKAVANKAERRGAERALGATYAALRFLGWGGTRLDRLAVLIRHELQKAESEED